MNIMKIIARLFFSMTNFICIYTSELPQGNYVLYLSVGNTRIPKKLVIQ